MFVYHVHFFGAKLKVNIRCSPGENFNCSGSVTFAKPSYSFKLKWTVNWLKSIANGKPFLNTKKISFIFNYIIYTITSYLSAIWSVISVSTAYSFMSKIDFTFHYNIDKKS